MKKATAVLKSKAEAIGAKKAVAALRRLGVIKKSDRVRISAEAPAPVSRPRKPNPEKHRFVIHDAKGNEAWRGMAYSQSDAMEQAVLRDGVPISVLKHLRPWITEHDLVAGATMVPSTRRTVTDAEIRRFGRAHKGFYGPFGKKANPRASSKQRRSFTVDGTTAVVTEVVPSQGRFGGFTVVYNLRTPNGKHAYGEREALSAFNKWIRMAGYDAIPAKPLSRRNPPRRRNIAGFRDASGEFHPLRNVERGAPYDPVRAGDVKAPKKKKKAAAAAKRKPAKKATLRRAPARSARAKARVTRAATSRRRSARR